VPASARAEDNNMNILGFKKTATDKAQAPSEEERPQGIKPPPLDNPPVRAVAQARIIEHDEVRLRPMSGTNFFGYMASIALATISTILSIIGNTTLFTGAFWAIIAIGCAFEAGKFALITHVATYKKAYSPAHKCGVVVVVIIMLGYDFIGAYGFLAKAHYGPVIQTTVTADTRVTDVDARIGADQERIRDIDKSVAVIDGITAGAANKGRARSATTANNENAAKRSAFTTEKTRLVNEIADLKKNRVTAEGDRKLLDADLGPLSFFAVLFGVTPQDILKWFIAGFAAIIEPLAVICLFITTKSREF
jgi:hypothetical protein